MVRVLLCGEVRGRVRELHRVLQQLQNKGPFDFALCSGSFFADPHDSEAAAACKDSSTQVVKSESSDLPEKADQSDVARAVRAELSQQFAAGFAELQHCCSSLPLPLYILDRAASECAQRLSARVDRGGSAVAVRSGEAAPERTAKEESAASAAAAAAARPAAAADSPSGNASDVLVEKNGQNEEKNGIKSTELSPAQPQAPPRAPRCTYSPLQLLDNVWLLAGAGVAQLEGLNVAFYTAQQTAESPGCNSNGSNDQQQQQQQQQQHENGTAGAKFISSLLDGWGGFRDFRGSTDLFVTTEPLLGMFDGLPPGVAPARFTQQQQPQQQQQPEPQQQQPEPQQQQQQGEHAGLESNVVKEEAAVDSESPEFHFRLWVILY
ncbi:hypothetical protein, conserved [Eimeria tenella]|uniref:Uncharacterized protein n=1 Tax=Eimeria tenella TaxID=5802 RepID=U6KXD8_EIMTE|nr:hypothetical protein, conserved [Eimeria tenella]CDJ42631.1 hypothetical protein, conserved [Eimeria tenella]|eukprot:XP_013233381.1 hypothetical protein, conserved [Eimeria tenella]